MATMEDQRKKLTPVQKRFVEEYLKDPSDGGAAYMRASGSTNKKSCTVQASKLLKMPKVEAALEDMANDMMGPVKARILKNVEFWLEIRDNPENRTMERMKASEHLGKWMQMFVDKKDVKIEAAVQILDTI